jgi:hypothetical protein
LIPASKQEGKEPYGHIAVAAATDADKKTILREAAVRESRQRQKHVNENNQNGEQRV